MQFLLQQSFLKIMFSLKIEKFNIFLGQYFLFFSKYLVKKNKTNT